MYAVYSEDKWKQRVMCPAGSYENFEDAVRHAQTVTYPMVVVHGGSVVYSNQDEEEDSRYRWLCNPAN